MAGVIDLTSDDAIPQSEQNTSQREAGSPIPSLNNSETIQISDSDSSSDENEIEPENETESSPPLIQIGRG